MKKKKIFLIFIVLFMLISIVVLVFFYFRNLIPKKQEIIIFNWGEYIDPQIIEEYNKKNEKYIVKQSYFASNELAVNKIKSGNQYDISILSEYAIEQLKDDYLEKIEFNRLFRNPNKTEIFKNQIQPKMEKIQEYIIPYFWGNLGFVYNKQKIKLNNENDFQKIIEDPKYKIALYNNSYEGLFLGLKVEGGDISFYNDNDISKAKTWLLNFKKKNINLSFITDQLLDRMKIAGEEKYDLALAYSGDARYLMQQNKNLGYYDFSQNINNKGTNLWADSLVLMKGSHSEGTYDFINFLLKQENIQKNTLFIGYDSPYWKPQREDEVLNLEVSEADKFYQYNLDLKKKINDAWNEIYSAPRPQDNHLLILSFFILFSFIIIRIKNRFQFD